MQYDENAEKYGYEGEMTPLKCDELNAYKGDVYIPVYGSIADADVYLKKDADKAIAELKDVIHELQTENTELKKKLMPCLNGDCILTCEVVEKYGKENAELKAKLEDVQASAYADSVDAGMRERRLKRALYKVCANWAHFAVAFFCSYTTKEKWYRMELKCRKKAKEYK